MKKKRARQSSPKVIKQEVQVVVGLAIEQEKRKSSSAAKVKDSYSNSKGVAVKQADGGVDLSVGGGGREGDANTYRFRSGVTTRSSGKHAAAADGTQSVRGPKAITDSPLPPISSSPNPNFTPVPEPPCLGEQDRSLRPQSHTIPVASNISSVESIGEHKPTLRWEQLNFIQKIMAAAPKARIRTFTAQRSIEPTAIIEEHHDDEHHKKKKSKHSLPETSSQQRLASIDVRLDSGARALADGSTEQRQPVPLLGHVEPLYNNCQDWSLERIDGACDALVVTELNEDSVLSCDNESLRDRFQSALANVRCVLMEVLRRFKEANMKLQRISKENEDLALHNNALVATTTMLGEHNKVQETKLKELEAELELCRSELSQSKTDLEQTEIEMEIELGAAKHEIAEMEARHQAVLNEVEAKHKAALSKAAEMAVKEFKGSRACEDDLVALVAPAYGMGFTEALDLAKRSGASIDLSQEAYARIYQPGSKDELMQRVALFKEGKDLSVFYDFAGPAEGEQVTPECCGDETAEDNPKYY